MATASATSRGAFQMCVADVTSDHPGTNNFCLCRFLATGAVSVFNSSVTIDGGTTFTGNIAQHGGETHTTALDKLFTGEQYVH